ncbi:SigE family RNA polymerase sigma factor [Actinoplanes sp. NPDC049681]|uniref:SigE family RNA polymerase sigma factor n=1 Tax=Actinoplanes sp. NPDC049681 TaxID=3363905 RepID=UPI0037AFA622
MSKHDELHFADFVHARSPALLRTAFLLTADSHLAQDLLQTALVKTWRAWRTIRDQEAPDAYVRRVMVTTATSWWRRKWWGERPAQSLPQTAAHDDPLDSIGARQALVTALARLPPRQRAVVVLRYYEDLSELQVAEVLGTSVGNVKSQASRGLRKLRADGALDDWAPQRHSACTELTMHGGSNGPF